MDVDRAHFRSPWSQPSHSLQVCAVTDAIDRLKGKRPFMTIDGTDAIDRPSAT